MPQNRPWRRWLAVAAAIGMIAACAPAAADQSTAAVTVHGPGYQAVISWTAYGIPHITARSFGSLGYGYGYALASEDLCTMADSYVTVEGQRSRYYGASAHVPTTPFTNLESDTFWQAVIDHHVIPRLLAVRTGPAAVGPRLRQLINGYVAGYNRYLRSVGGARGVPDPACRARPWVRPITALDAYLLVYQDLDQDGLAADPGAAADAHPPASSSHVRAARPATALRDFARPLITATRSGEIGSNAIAVGSAGTRDHHGILLGNPHFSWQGADRFFEVQLTVPGTMNVEGASLVGIPLVIIGFTASMAWSLTVSTAWTFTPYQLTLVPGHPTRYRFDGRSVPMVAQRVTVQTAAPGGGIKPVRRTVWYTRYGPVITSLEADQLPWTSKTAFALADANASNFRFFGTFLATDEATSVRHELSVLKRYEGLPFVNLLAADSAGRALYAGIVAVPDVTNAEAQRCDTYLGRLSFSTGGPPILDGSRASCAWGTDRDSAVPGIFGGAEQPVLMTRDFAENSNDSYWMTNPSHPLTGYPRIIGGADTGVPGSQGSDLGLRTRSALAMVMRRISGTDGLGPPGFTFQNMKNLMFSDIQYGATLVKRQLVAMCRSFRHGRAPLSGGGTIAVGDSCRVLARWNGRENVGSRGAVLFRAFWENALRLPIGPWSTFFDPASPLSTPSGLAASRPPVQQAFGDALVSMRSARLSYDVALGTVQYVVRNGSRIPLPGGPGDPDGEFNAIYDNVIGQPAAGPTFGSSYIQVVTWASGDRCPRAATLLTYSQSDNPRSRHYADQTELFSHSRWVTALFCPAQVAAHTVSVTVLRGR